MIDYSRLLKELEEEKEACQYAYGGMVPAFYAQALRKAIEDIKGVPGLRGGGEKNGGVRLRGGDAGA